MLNNPRTCVVSKKKLAKCDLIRFFVESCQVKIDKDQTKKNRGFYIEKNPEITFLKFAKAIFKQTKIEVQEQIYLEFQKLIFKGKES